MVLLSLKDYAKQNNVSYEAIRKQIVRYKKDLEGHLIRDGRQQFLDEEAVAFLDDKRAKNPVAIINISKDEALEAVKAKYTTLLESHTALQKEMSALQQENYRLSSENARIALLEADNEAARLKIQEAANDAQKARDELTEARRVMQKDLDDAIAAFNQRTKELEDKIYLKQQENEQLRNTKLLKRIFGWKKED